MTRVVCQVVRWVSEDPSPGLVEAQLTDAHGTTWSVVDKPEVFDDRWLTPDIVPIEVELACEVVDTDGALVTVSTALQWEATTGRSDTL